VRASDPQLLSRDESFEYEHPRSVPLNLTAPTGHAERPIRSHQYRVALIVAAIGGSCLLASCSGRTRHGPTPTPASLSAVRGFLAEAKQGSETLGDLIGDRQ
jgi:hypothetical protein